MCIIVDANRLGVFLAEPTQDEVRPIYDWLRRRKGKLVYSTGGQFASEVGRGLREKLQSLVEADLAKYVPAEEFEEEEKLLRENQFVRSNDLHVLALARKTQTRLLFTADSVLMDDFKNLKVVARPKGKIYSGAKNADLLDRFKCPLV